MTDLHAPGVLDSVEALVPLARAGDQLAFARIVRLFRTDMVRVAWVVAGDARTASEAVAQAWPLVANRLGRLEDSSRLRPWLCAIAARGARDIVRRDSRRVRQPFAPEAARDGGSDGGAEGEALHSDAALRLALGRLAVDDRLLLALRHVADLAPDELGRATGMTPAAALARTDELRARIDGASTDGEVGAGQLGARLRALADIPVAPVDIDLEARRAILTRNDRRIRLVSVAIAVLAAILAVSIQYIAGPTSLPSARDASPSPSASFETSPESPEPGSRGG